MDELLNYLKVMILSAVPIVEQRGAIPMGIFLYNFDPPVVFLISLLGSLLPVPFILLLFNSIFKWMENIKFLNKFYNFVDSKVRKGTGKVLKYEKIGLILFVAIPLPTTGLWTGSAIAAFLGFDFKKSLLYVFLGGLISAVIITAACMFLPSLFGY